MSADPECSVVIPHLRGSRPLLACLHSLHRSTRDLEIIVVDNASTDGSVDQALAIFPAIKVVRATENLGYAGGANLGLHNARGRWCIFLNDDAVAAPGAIEALITKLELAPQDDIPFLQAALRRSGEPDLFDYAGGAGGLMDRWGFPFALGRLFEHLEPDHGQYRRAGPLAWASGCCLAGPTETFLGLGGFEESFFAHFEEIDLCWRWRRSGGRIEAVPWAVVYHMGPSTLPAGARKTYLNYRNNLWTLRRNLPRARLAGVLMVRAFLDAAALLRWLVLGKPALAAAVVRGWCSGLFRRPWSRVQPGPSVQPERSGWGTYRGSIVVAAYLKRVRSTSQLLGCVKGWDASRSVSRHGEDRT
ncbi:MAG: glycosyltransferase family 2 protein [Candidatus Latescibacteria bacterium]|nr:glycosyltransferase family 2 protein [Candidatus Latescibacterota bacterium]